MKPESGEPIVKEGSLYKRGHVRKVRVLPAAGPAWIRPRPRVVAVPQNWKLRYFLLSTTCLFYRTAKEGAEKGRVRRACGRRGGRG